MCSPIIKELASDITTFPLTFTLALFPTPFGRKKLSKNNQRAVFTIYDNIKETFRLAYHDFLICQMLSYIQLRIGIKESARFLIDGKPFEDLIEYIAIDIVAEAFTTSNMSNLVNDAEGILKSMKFVHFKTVVLKYNAFSFYDYHLSLKDVEIDLLSKLRENIDNAELKFQFAYGFDARHGQGVIPLMPGQPGQECDRAMEITTRPFCPSIILPIQNDSIMLEDMPSLLIWKQGKVYTFTAFSISDDLSEAYICLDDYKSQMINHVNDSSNVSTINVGAYLTVVCLIVSLISLAATLFVYTALPDLRNVPGLNLMGLSSSLMLSSALFLVSSFTEVAAGWGCSLLGALLHFSLLSGFAWMFVCTFHMVTVFASLTATATHTNKNVFFKYLLSTITVPLAIVGSYIVCSFIQFNDYGYGGRMCYIVHSDFILYFVGIPLLVVLVMNAGMFIFIVCKVARLPTVRSSAQQERDYIKIFAKLSTLTGFTWIFGFIYQFSRLDMFSYLFIIFNAGQGVFIFSSPEHEVLMVSYCGQWLSVVRRRPSSVVRRASSVVRQHLMFTL